MINIISRYINKIASLPEDLLGPLDDEENDIIDLQMEIQTHLNTTYRRNNMSDGLNLTGFNETGEQSGSNTIDSKPTGQELATAFPAKDVSSQDGAGLGNNGK